MDGHGSKTEVGCTVGYAGPTGGDDGVRRDDGEPQGSNARRRGSRSLCAAFACTAIAIGAASSLAQADVVGAWNFNTWDPAFDGKVAADHGVGVLSLSEFAEGLAVYGGSGLNAVDGDEAGSALGVVGRDRNGAGMLFEVDATGWEDLAFSFAMRRTSTGFDTVRLSTFDGTAWASLGEASGAPSTWETAFFDVGDARAFADTLLIRLEVDGATGSTGTIRFDNIVLSGTVVPAPAAGWLFVACRMRRRRR